MLGSASAVSKLLFRAAWFLRGPGWYVLVPVGPCAL